MNHSTAWNRVRFLLPEFEPVEFDIQKLEAAMKSALPSLPELHGVDEDCVLVDPQYVRLIFGDVLRLTKSRIATFAECPYKYWCEYVLKLREIKVSEIGYADSGTIIHYVLENFLRKFRAEDGSVLRPSHEETEAEISSLITEYIDSINCPDTNTLTYQFSRLRDLSLIMVENVLDEFEASKFKIVAMEKNISDLNEESLKPMQIKVYDGEEFPVVNLGGTVDRIDIYDDGECKYLRIVDYKTGSHKFDVRKVSTGADLQLPAYLFTAALKENSSFYNKNDDEKEIFPASALFLSANEKNGEILPERSGFILNEKEFLEAVNKDFNRKMLAGILVTKAGDIKGNAAVSKSDIDVIDTTLRTSIKACAQNMYSGKAPRTPSSDACMFCPMKSTCHMAHKGK
jgi:ATP-dependent helicase/nuclease subunit B